MYEDNVQPSKQLQVPVADSVRIATARVRQKSNNIAERITHNHSIERLRTASATPLRAIRHKTSGAIRPFSPRPQTQKPISPVEEMPETSWDAPGTLRSRAGGGGGTSPYLHPSGFSSGSGVDVNSRTTLLSPHGHGNASTLANPIAQPAESVTVRLVDAPEHARFVVGPKPSGSSSESGDSRPGSPSSGEDSFEANVGAGRERRGSWSEAHARQEPGRARTPVSAVLSAYYQESIRGDNGQMQHGFVASPGQYYEEPAAPKQEPVVQEMSWPLLLFVLSAITVVSALLRIVDRTRVVGRGWC